MNNLSNIKGIRDLNTREQSEITGGESYMYYLAYYIGTGVRLLESALDSPPDLPSATVYK